MTEQESCAWRLFKYFFVNKAFINRAIVPTLTGIKTVLSKFLAEIDEKLDQIEG